MGRRTKSWSTPRRSAPRSSSPRCLLKGSFQDEALAAHRALTAKRHSKRALRPPHAYDDPALYCSAMIIPGPTYVYWGGNSLYVNLTSRCSAACSFCLREGGWEVYGYDLRLDVSQEPEA